MPKSRSLLFLGLFLASGAVALVYEILWLLPVAAVLWRRRQRSPFLFGEYIAANGFGRIFVETLRVNPKVAFGLTEPQIVGLALVVLGVGSWLYLQRQRRAELLAA